MDAWLPDCRREGVTSVANECDNWKCIWQDDLWEYLCGVWTRGFLHCQPTQPSMPYYRRPVEAAASWRKMLYCFHPDSTGPWLIGVTRIVQRYLTLHLQHSVAKACMTDSIQYLSPCLDVLKQCTSLFEQKIFHEALLQFCNNRGKVYRGYARPAAQPCVRSTTCNMYCNNIRCASQQWWLLTDVNLDLRAPPLVNETRTICLYITLCYPRHVI